EHAAHGDVVERSLTADHRDAVGRDGHSHVTHVAHAGWTHRHVVRQERTHLLIEASGFNADHVGYLVPHLVHDVVRHVAVHGPVTRIVGDELDRACAADGHQHGRLRPLTGFRNLPAVGLGDLEVVAVKMDGMVIHRGQVADAD